MYGDFTDYAVTVRPRLRRQAFLLCLQPPGVRPFWVAGLPETALERWQRGVLPGWLREGVDLEPKEVKPVDPTQPIETPIYKDSGP